MKKQSLKEPKHICSMTSNLAVAKIETKSSIICYIPYHSSLVFGVIKTFLSSGIHHTDTDILKEIIPHGLIREWMPSFPVSASGKIYCHLYTRIKAKNWHYSWRRDQEPGVKRENKFKVQVLPRASPVSRLLL